MGRSFQGNLLVFPSVIGNLISDSFSGSSLGSNWSVTSPNTSISVSGGDLLLNRAVGGGYQLSSDYLLYTGYGGTCLEDWKISVPFKITETSATSTGFAIGVKSTANWYSNYWHLVQFNTNSGAGNKKLNFYLAGATTATVSSATALTASLNDECLLEVTRTASSSNGQQISATVTNLTNPNYVSLTYTFSEAYPITIGTPPTSYFSIFPLVGNITLHSFTVSTTWYNYGNIVAVGDSITKGLYSLSYSNRWTSLLFSSSSKINYSCGGPGDRTSSVLDRMNEIKNVLRPRYVILMIGGNDLDGGVAMSTVQTNYSNIFNQLILSGITVFHCLPTPRNSYNFSSWNSWITSNFSNVINTNTPLLGSGYSLSALYNSGDGTHPNTAGHSLISSTANTTISPYL